MQQKLNRGSTCNQAEYAALAKGLGIACMIGVKSVIVQGDSKLACWQPLHQLVMELKNQFETFSISHIPTAENRPPDRLAKTVCLETSLADR
uniref:RNase H type-1 domain-containing protein n=1 Tax=Physcomitrium patens TaxID=3218 RepID=A0A2K1J3L5_PHYPA|nr:hypothetical protein PHYPA_021966 [Physcomitrium patens]